MPNLTHLMRGWTMDLDEKIGWLLLGCALGYTLRWMQTLKREVDEIDEIVTRRDRDDAGFVRMPLVLDVMIVILFAATMWTVYADYKQGKEDQRQDDRIEVVGKCTLEFTAKTIRALNERTTYTQGVATSNVDVLESQLEFLQLVLLLPPVDADVRREALSKYVESVDDFVNLSDLAEGKTNLYKYPTNIELSKCLGTAAVVKKESP